jgi:arylsulfatase A-like enzyme
VEGFEAPPIDTWTGGRPTALDAPPALRPEDLASLARQRARASATLLAVDEHLHAMVDLIFARGEWDRTVVIFLSDNGLAFGEHGWAGKRVPYEASIGVPFAVRWPPAVTAAPGSALVSNLDIVPTVAALAGLPPRTTDGRSLLGTIPASRTVPLWWGGDEEVPAWRGVRSADAVLIRWSSGERELFDLRGDPGQMRNLIDDPSWAGIARRLAGLLPKAAFPPG